MSRLFTFLTASGPNTDIDACSTRSRSICGGGAPGRGLDRCVRLPIARSARGTASRTHNRGPGDVHAEPTPGRASDPYGRPASGRSRGPSAGSGKLNQSTPSGDVERPEWIHSEHARFQMPGEGSPGIVTAEAKGRPGEIVHSGLQKCASSAIDRAVRPARGRPGAPAPSPRTPPDPAAAATPKPLMA